MGNIFEQSTIGTATNQIIFNNTAGSPYYRLTDRYSLGRQLREFDIPIPEAMGAADFQTLIGKSNYVLAGIMYPDDENGYDTGKKALRKLGNLAIEQADSASDSGYVPYKWSEGDGVNKLLNLKVLYTDFKESSRKGLKVPFRLFCKVKDQAILSQSAASTSIGNASSSTSSGTGYSFLYPVLYGSTTYSANGSINNLGDLGAWPSIVINGPINNPRLTNTTTGQYIEVAVNLATTGDSLIINYDHDSIAITQAGNSVHSSLSNASTLFKVQPGVNAFTLSGSSVGSGAYATLAIFHTYSLS